jgi:hypothetical protein
MYLHTFFAVPPRIVCISRFDDAKSVAMVCEAADKPSAPRPSLYSPSPPSRSGLSWLFLHFPYASKTNSPSETGLGISLVRGCRCWLGIEVSRNAICCLYSAQLCHGLSVCCGSLCTKVCESSCGEASAIWHRPQTAPDEDRSMGKEVCR